MKIILHIETGAILIDTDDIILLKSEGKNTTVIFSILSSEPEEFISVMNLANIETFLPLVNFFCPKRGSLINFEHFIGFDTPKSEVILTGGIRITVARQRKADFKSLLDEFLIDYNSKNDIFALKKEIIELKKIIISRL